MPDIPVSMERQENYIHLPFLLEKELAADLFQRAVP
jgi:hypothetical protein